MSSTCFFHDPFTDSSLPLAMVLPGSALPPNNLLNASIFPALQETLTDKDANASIGLCDYLTDFNRCPHSVSCRPVPPTEGPTEDWPTNPIARTHRGSRLTDSPRRGAEPTERLACARKCVILYSSGIAKYGCCNAPVDKWCNCCPVNNRWARVKDDSRRLNWLRQEQYTCCM